MSNSNDGHHADPEPGAAAPAENNQHEGHSIVSRRRFVVELTAATGALAMGGRRVLARPQTELPPPQESDIEHVVVLMMENRSFDHFLGWVPGSDGRQADLTYLDRSGTPRSTYPLAPEYQGCSHPDPDHTYQGGRVEYNDGACDGWLLAGENDAFAIGYYTAADLRFFGQAVPEWTTCDRYFSSILAPTYPNRFYQHSGQTDRLDNAAGLVNLPTIWDRLSERGLQGRYYYNDVPFIALWGRKYLSIGGRISDFLTDCATNNLPHVAFVDPRFIGAARGLANDDHPYADIRNGQVFLNRIYKAVTQGPGWPKTLLIINYDEWGGFFDHVAPPVAPIPEADQAAGNDGRLGFRVANLLVGPWARRGYVSNTVYDHTSILKLIEWRWDLEPLTVRDASANNLAEALDFGQPSLSAPQFPVPFGLYGRLCPRLPGGSDQWISLRAMADRYGWPD